MRKENDIKVLWGIFGLIVIVAVSVGAFWGGRGHPKKADGAAQISGITERAIGGTGEGDVFCMIGFSSSRKAEALVFWVYDQEGRGGGGGKIVLRAIKLPLLRVVTSEGETVVVEISEEELEYVQSSAKKWDSSDAARFFEHAVKPKMNNAKQ